MSNLIRSKDWRTLLDGLMAERGVDLKYIADYMDAPYNGAETVFYAKIPKKRLRFIGIGMALRQPLETINQWITEYSSNHTLYVKDVTEDLIWIYLIGLNHANPNAETNYFKRFEECREAVLVIYEQLWDEFALGSIGTADLEIELEKISYDDTFAGLRQFIIDHMDSFKTAYARPRRLLNQYLDCLLAPDLTSGGHHRTLNSLRGNLDDSMINYLSGNSEYVNTMRHGRPVRSIGFKPIPKNRKTHISLCLALGMTAEDINRYLELMGFAPLRDKGDEARLFAMLEYWDKKRPLQRSYKSLVFGGHSEIKLSDEQKKAAIQEMIHLRRDLQFEYSKQGLIFPYG